MSSSASGPIIPFTPKPPSRTDARDPPRAAMEGPEAQERWDRMLFHNGPKGPTPAFRRVLPCWHAPLARRAFGLESGMGPGVGEHRPGPRQDPAPRKPAVALRPAKYPKRRVPDRSADGGVPGRRHPPDPWNPGPARPDAKTHPALRSPEVFLGRSCGALRRRANGVPGAGGSGEWRAPRPAALGAPRRAAGKRFESRRGRRGQPGGSPGAERDPPRRGHCWVAGRRDSRGRSAGRRCIRRRRNPKKTGSPSAGRRVVPSIQLGAWRFSQPPKLSLAPLAFRFNGAACGPETSWARSHRDTAANPGRVRRSVAATDAFGSASRLRPCLGRASRDAPNRHGSPLLSALPAPWAI